MPPSPPSRVRVRVPAKINPFLAVRGVRDDGYHELVTVFQSVSLHDTLTAEFIGDPARLLHPAGRRRTAVTLAHDAGPSVPTDESNLVMRAARVLADHLGLHLTSQEEAVADGGVTTALDLRKRIPVAAGMAGGSADAAAALITLNEMWGAEIARGDLRSLGAAIGADVPFCVVGGTALATGTGTGFVRVLCRGTFNWVVCTAADELSTPGVYRAWDEQCEPNEVQPDAVLAAVTKGDAEALGAALHNDLQAAAEHLLPHLVADRKALMDAGALGAVVSGSGPTIVALASDPDDAHRIAGRVAGRFASVHVTVSPAGGPLTERC